MPLKRVLRSCLDIHPSKQRKPDQTNGQSPASSIGTPPVLAVETGVMLETSRNPISTGSCYILNLPSELRRIVFQQIFGSIIVYLRTLPQIRDDNSYAWYNALEWNNPCPEVLRVSHQVRDEALEVVLQNCVLDLWGSSTHNRMFFQSLPKASSQIRHVAITFDRLYDIHPSKATLSSLEVLFVDSIHQTKTSFIQAYKYHINSSQAPLRGEPPATISYLTLRDILTPKRQRSRKGKSLKIFLRCITWDEETILLVTDIEKEPQVWEQPVVPKFEYKFAQRQRAAAQQEKAEKENAATKKET